MQYRWSWFMVLTLPLAAQGDFWELAPIRYSETAAEDRLAMLAAQWGESSTGIHGVTPLARMREVLAALNVPEESQILVFSKTSKQNSLISPSNPRALYFSLDTYCGYVPGGAMEVIVQDPRLGPVFYLIDLGGPNQPIRVERDSSECLSCHGTGRTENVPGVFIRSVYPDEGGHPVLSMGSGVITHQTPVSERWGGYYVTGSISLPHLGNRTYTDARAAEPEFEPPIHELSGRIDSSKYPRATSDMVALMVLEHQCQAHNLLTAASMNYRRAIHLGKVLDPDADPDQGSAGRVADHAADGIVKWFLYQGEADQGVDGVEGDAAFQERFQQLVPKTQDGKSLADFELNHRLFKHRCSYMVYSNAFRQLPEPVKRRVIAGLKRVLESPATDDGYPTMKIPERRKIAMILRETGVF